MSNFRILGEKALESTMSETVPIEENEDSEETLIIDSSEDMNEALEELQYCEESLASVLEIAKSAIKDNTMSKESASVMLTAIGIYNKRLCIKALEEIPSLESLSGLHTKKIALEIAVEKIETSLSILNKHRSSLNKKLNSNHD